MQPATEEDRPDRNKGFLSTNFKLETFSLLASLLCCQSVRPLLLLQFGLSVSLMITANRRHFSLSLSGQQSG